MLNYCKNNLWRAFVDLLIDNDEKVASWKHAHIKASVQKPYPIYDQNGQNQLNSISYFMTKTAEKPHPLGSHIPI